MLKKLSKRHKKAETFTIEVELKDVDNQPALVRNISPEGMLLELDSVKQQPGSKIRLACLLNNQKWLIPGTVTHANPRGLGVKFDRPQPGLMRVAVAKYLSKQVQPIAGRFVFG